MADNLGNDPFIDEEESGGISAQDEREAELAQLLSSPLFAGPDAAIVEEIKDCDAPDLDPAYLLAKDAELESEVERIYAQIVQRAPEHKVQPSLERVRQVLDMMGNPQNAFRAIHITGTNGKTSTARMIEALLRERGLRTGRFTSPHLNNVRERISIDGEAISRASFIQAWEDVAPFVEIVDAQGGPRMSFFEVFTVMAYAAFADAPIDVAVVEVGMGGQWDATNVIDAEVAVITPISRDHEKWLGYEISQIAHEKSGIIKEGATVVTSAQVEDAAREILSRSAQMGATVIHEGPDLHVVSREGALGGQMVTIKTPSAVYEDVPLAMLGAFQSENAAVALAAVEAFFGGGALPGEVVEHALMSTVSPGRMEVVKRSPTVLVDAAHNPAGAKVTREALEETFLGPRVAVYSAMADKDIEGVLSELEPAFNAIVITQIEGTDRAADPEELAQIAREIFGEERVEVEYNLMDAMTRASDLAETADPDSVVPGVTVVLGSIMLAGQARHMMGAQAPDKA